MPFQVGRGVEFCKLGAECGKVFRLQDEIRGGRSENVGLLSCAQRAVIHRQMRCRTMVHNGATKKSTKAADSLSAACGSFELMSSRYQAVSTVCPTPGENRDLLLKGRPASAIGLRLVAACKIRADTGIRHDAGAPQWTSSASSGLRA